MQEILKKLTELFDQQRIFKQELATKDELNALRAKLEITSVQVAKNTEYRVMSDKGRIHDYQSSVLNG